MTIKILLPVLVGILLYKLVEAIYKAGYQKGLIDGKKGVKNK